MTGGPSSIEVVAVQEAVIESAASGEAVDVANCRERGFHDLIGR